MANILLVDDDDQVRAMLKWLLIDAGYEVSEARDGAEALRLYKERRPDLLITDLVMPEKEGLALIMDLRRQDPDLQIIAMSGAELIKGSYLSPAKKLGAQYILAKPFGNDEFLEAVRLLLEHEG
jgi:DNA-binding response OmpR family regulator